MVEMISQMGSALVTLLNNTLLALPGIVAAILVLILGYIIAAIIGWVVRELLERVDLDKRLHKICKAEVCREVALAGISGTIIKWYVFIIFLGTSAQLVDLGVLTGFIQTLVNWLPNVIVAVIFVLLSLLLGEYVEHKVVETRIKGAHLFGQILYVAIVTLVGIISLNQIGIDVSLLENIVLAVVGGLSIGVALALGISLGLGLKDEAKKFVKELRK